MDPGFEFGRRPLVVFEEYDWLPFPEYWVNLSDLGIHDETIEAAACSIVDEVRTPDQLVEFVRLLKCRFLRAFVVEWARLWRSEGEEGGAQRDARRKVCAEKWAEVCAGIALRVLTAGAPVAADQERRVSWASGLLAAAMGSDCDRLADVAPGLPVPASTDLLEAFEVFGDSARDTAVATGSCGCWLDALAAAEFLVAGSVSNRIWVFQLPAYHALTRAYESAFSVPGAVELLAGERPIAEHVWLAIGVPEPSVDAPQAGVRLRNLAMHLAVARVDIADGIHNADHVLDTLEAECGTCLLAASARCPDRRVAARRCQRHVSGSC